MPRIKRDPVPEVDLPTKVCSCMSLLSVTTAWTRDLATHPSPRLEVGEISTLNYDPHRLIPELEVLN